MAAVFLTLVPNGADAKPKKRWEVTRVTDPITGASTCVVAAYDKVLGKSFSRVGYLYPIVEKNDKLGLLVGVSSGGRYRIPTGDIVWRVDQRPHRELRAVDNPAGHSAHADMPQIPNATPEMMEMAKRTYTQAMNQAQALMSTSTVASGAKAQEMLAEMIAGQQLIYRAAAATPAYGLPNSRSHEVGEYTSKGLKPIPLDDSFRLGLKECGITM
jgi:hypothetical protein